METKVISVIIPAHHEERYIARCLESVRFGDWYLFRSQRMVRRLLTGRDQEAANLFYYDMNR